MQRASLVKISVHLEIYKSSVLEEIKQLETRLENQIFKTNALEKELEGLKKIIF